MNNKEYVLNKITDSECSETPWRHLIIKDFLPKNLYEGVKSETTTYTDNKVLEETGVIGKAHILQNTFRYDFTNNNSLQFNTIHFNLIQFKYLANLVITVPFYFTILSPALFLWSI